MTEVDLRCGSWELTLADLAEVDTLITDTPFSERTHKGALSSTREEGVTGYDWWTEEDARAFVASWAPRTKGWMVVHNDDVLGPVFREAMLDAWRYAFPLLPVLQHQPRVQGDGPAQHGHYLIVSRPKRKSFLGWGSLPGWYHAKRDGSIVRGGKPLDLMRAIVRDYSAPGALICDPCAGGGTTLLAALVEGRRAVGSEKDPTTHRKALRRVLRGFSSGLVKGAA